MKKESLLATFICQLIYSIVTFAFDFALYSRHFFSVIEIASSKNAEGLAILENEAKLYAFEMKKFAEKDNVVKVEKNCGKSSKVI